MVERELDAQCGKEDEDVMEINIGSLEGKGRAICLDCWNSV